MHYEGVNKETAVEPPSMFPSSQRDSGGVSKDSKGVAMHGVRTFASIVFSVDVVQITGRRVQDLRLKAGLFSRQMGC